MLMPAAASPTRCSRGARAERKQGIVRPGESSVEGYGSCSFACCPTSTKHTSDPTTHRSSSLPHRECQTRWSPGGGGWRTRRLRNAEPVHVIGELNQLRTVAAGIDQDQPVLAGGFGRCVETRHDGKVAISTFSSGSRSLISISLPTGTSDR